PFVSTNTFPFATSGTVNFAVKSIASRAPACVLLYSSVFRLLAEYARRIPGAVVPGSATLGSFLWIAHSIPFVLPFADTAIDAPGYEYTIELFDVGVVVSNPFV